jgi:hypothetical protein
LNLPGLYWSREFFEAGIEGKIKEKKGKQCTFPCVVLTGSPGGLMHISRQEAKGKPDGRCQHPKAERVNIVALGADVLYSHFYPYPPERPLFSR